jgi:hypothetical protein
LSPAERHSRYTNQVPGYRKIGLSHAIPVTAHGISIMDDRFPYMRPPGLMLVAADPPLTLPQRPCGGDKISTLDSKTPNLLTINACQASRDWRPSLKPVACVPRYAPHREKFARAPLNTPILCLCFSALFYRQEKTLTP